MTSLDKYTTYLLVLLAALMCTWQVFAHKSIAESPDNPGAQKQSVQPITPLSQAPASYRVPPTGYLPPPATTETKEGKALYAAMNCASCHSIAGMGGYVGPPLDGVGGRRSEEFLQSHLTDPAEHAKRFPHLHDGNRMPHPHATPDEVKALASYLMTLPEPQGGFLIQAHPPLSMPPKAIPESRPSSSASIDEGRQLFLEKGCAACHSVGGFGSSFGPKLDRVGQRLGRGLIEMKITAKGKLGAGMQWRGVNDEEASKITEYLLSLPSQ
jgi:mono/diheme cytochrome c family protein